MGPHDSTKARAVRWPWAGVNLVARKGDHGDGLEHEARELVRVLGSIFNPEAARIAVEKSP